MKKKSNLKRLMEYAEGYSIWTYLSWILSAIAALLALVPYWYIFQMVREAVTVAPDFGSATGIAHNGWMAVLFAAVAVVLFLAALMCSHTSAFRTATNIKLTLLHHIEGMPLGSVEQVGSGKMRRIIADTSGAAETYLAHQLPDMARAYATVIGLLPLLFGVDWIFGILCILPIVIGFGIMSRMTGESMQNKMKEYQSALADMSNESVEYVRGVPVVKTFGQTIFSFRRFKDSIDRYAKWAIAYTNELRKPMMFYTLAINSAFIFLIGAGLAAGSREATQTFLVRFIYYIIITPAINVSLTRLMRLKENEMVVTDALSRIDDVLDMPLQENAGEETARDTSIEVRNVKFSYDPEKEVNAIDGISLSIPQGSTVAFVGPSGGGKSTLASLLARFHDPQEGEIRVGGVSVKDIPKDKLADLISFVFQDSRLIKGSILENVRLAKPEASEEAVMHALKQAQCQEIIDKFPDGVHTVIGSKGIYLSGGEGQRIAIARAILKDTPILILDEATAFADPDNESKVQAAFSQLMKGKTVIMIAHRLSTVRGAGRIYVLQNGTVAEEGTFEELTGKNGVFAGMWEEYQKSVSWKVGKDAKEVSA